MENNVCCSCQKPKATLECGHCKSAVCKNCAQFLEKDTFSFLQVLSEELSHSTYCGACYDNHVAPQLADYSETMEEAKNVAVFFKTQTKETRLLKRKEKPFKVKDCPDREETLLRLAFLAAKAKFNGLIDVDIQSEKVLQGRYQSTKWSGTGIPVQLESKRLLPK
ncbi:hypothetical protein AZI85_01350 [Bdellovibrio bacteriovorus]|uniref:Uncharacterized protein n=1 Tax=Bdellovibrio bacteriovorus TaxID=959 RepID=A0A150WVX8_BDEBC|nr:hypothetical protein [Bdellovibrio bacteriovorus]KYG70611.1 hypothetical protein AZI85_01350 [Bdellovibrio bacteriovorus]